MPPLRRRRRWFIGILAVLVAIDVAAGVFLLSPWGRSRSGLEEEYSRLRTEWQSKNIEIAPLESIDRKLVTAQKDIAGFYNTRLPDESSQISEDLGRLANENNVRLSEVKYTTKDADIPGLRQVMINASLTGDYLQIVKFINALERDHRFYILDGISLAEQQGGNVRLQMQVETYLRTAS